MNVENLNKVADLIERHEENFSLGEFWNSPQGRTETIAQAVETDCGSVGCICGWTIVHQAYEEGHRQLKIGLLHMGYTGKAGNYLGLSEQFTEELFCPYKEPEDSWLYKQAAELGIIEMDVPTYDITGIQAAKVLRAIAEGLIY